MRPPNEGARRESPIRVISRAREDGSDEGRPLLVRKLGVVRLHRGDAEERDAKDRHRFALRQLLGMEGVELVLGQLVLSFVAHAPVVPRPAASVTSAH
jgi:hypothetical protein